MVWKTLIAAVVFVGLCVVGLCFNILFRKNGKFPETEISRNPEMRRRGIRCVNEEEAIRLRRERAGSGRDNASGSARGSASSCAEYDCGSCAGCDLIGHGVKKSEEK